MVSPIIRIGLSACFFYPDPNRDVFITKTLLYYEESLVHWLMSYGIFPTLLPRSISKFACDDILSQVDGLILQGGSDISPQSYGQKALKKKWEGDQERDKYEIELVHAALRLNKPVLGICRGLQLINVAFGGSLYQDIPTQVKSKQQHRNPKLYDKLFHEVCLESSSYLAEIYKDIPERRVISIHHQAIDRLGSDLVIEARSPSDGIIEGLRYNGGTKEIQKPYIVGVQWHPEFQDSHDSELMSAKPLLNSYIDAVLSSQHVKDKKT